MSLLTDTAVDLDQLGISPRHVEVDHPPTGTPIVTLTLATVADLRAWCAADRARIEHALLAHNRDCRHYWALYERPGRVVLAQCLVWRHMPEWGLTLPDLHPTERTA